MNSFFIKGLSKVRLLNKLNVTSSNNINGRHFTIPIIKGTGRDNLVENEKWMLNVLKDCIKKKKGAFIDVGINVGQTLMRVKSIQPDLPYFGFEPNPICIYYLEDLIARNKITDVKVFPVGIADKTQIVELNFYYDSDTDQAASIIADFRPTQKIVKKKYIPCYTMESFYSYIDFSSIGTIKIDVEGAELEVLQGLNDCISSSRPFIIAEVLPVYKQENKARLDRQIKIQDILRQHRYRIFRIMSNSAGEFTHYEPLEEIGIHSDMSFTNYVFCPEEQSL